MQCERRFMTWSGGSRAPNEIERPPAMQLCHSPRLCTTPHHGTAGRMPLMITNPACTHSTPVHWRHWRFSCQGRSN